MSFYISVGECTPFVTNEDDFKIAPDRADEACHL